jgi:Tol biopolymer transport system component
MHPALSPDGTRVAVRLMGARCEIGVYDFTTGHLVRLPIEGDNHSPFWWPDGRRLLVQSGFTGAPTLVSVRADGGAAPVLVHEGPGTPVPAGWSPEGRTLVAQMGLSIGVFTVAGDPPRLTERARFPGTAAALSRDGRLVAYASAESGRSEIYVRPMASIEGRRQVTTDGGRYPAWGPAGELFYMRESQMMMVPTVGRDDPAFGRPQALFTARSDPWLSDARRNYDVAPDGQRFLMVQTDDDITRPAVTVIADWRDELGRSGPSR